MVKSIRLELYCTREPATDSCCNLLIETEETKKTNHFLELINNGACSGRE